MTVSNLMNPWETIEKFLIHKDKITDTTKIEIEIEVAEGEEVILRIKTKGSKKKAIMTSLIKMTKMSRLLHGEVGIEIKITKETIKRVVDEVVENTDKNRITEINMIVLVMTTAKVGLQTQNIDKNNKIKIENEELVIHTKTSNKIMLKRINKIILMANNNNKDTNRKVKAVGDRVVQPDKARCLSITLKSSRSRKL